MSQEFILIVQQYSQPPERFEEFLRLLCKDHQLDMFHSRQRLLGRSQAILAQGAYQQLEKISATLSAAGCVHWLIDPVKPTFTPERIYGLEASSRGVSFACQKQQVEFAQGASVLAVLADISGGLAEKLMGRMLAANAYHGRDAVRHEEQEQLIHLILQGQPVLDLYQLNGEKKVSTAVRVFPGRFNPQGLGAAASLSSRKTLKC